MIDIGNDDKVIETLRGKNSLLDGDLLSIEVKKLDGLIIAILGVEMRSGSDYSYVELLFEDVRGLGFIYDDGYSFGFIEQVKFFKSEELFYLVLEPYNELELSLEDEDQKYIVAKSVKGKVEEKVISDNSK